MPTPRPLPVRFLTSERLYLRPLEMADEPTLRRWYNEEATRTRLETYWPITEAFERRYIENNGADDRGCSFAIVRNKGDRLIGGVGFRSVRWKDRTVELGLVIGETAERGRGYGAEASVMLLRYLFDTLNLNRVQLGVWDFNEPAIRCYEKIGFVLEGRQRQHGFVAGRYVDHLIYGILADDYRARYAGSANQKAPSQRSRAGRRK